MASNRLQAYVKIYQIDGESKILVERSNGKHINVYISSRCVRHQLQTFRSVLPKFLLELYGYSITSVESAQTIPQYITNVFLHICRQVDSSVELTQIRDELGRIIIIEDILEGSTRNQMTMDRPVLERQNAQQADVPYMRLPPAVGQNPTMVFQQSVNDVIRSISSGNIDSNTWQSLVTNLGSSLVQLGQNPPAANLNTPFTNLLRQFHASQQNESKVNRDESKATTNTQSNTNQPSHTINDLNRIIDQTINEMDQATNLLEQTNVNTPETNTNLNQNLDLNLNPSLNLTEPVDDRFVEDRRNAAREIIIQQENINLIDTSVAGQTSSTRPAVLQRLSSNQINRVHPILVLVSAINNKILSGKTKYPNFNKKTKSGYTRIKNYIHHLTRVWLTRSEIDLFVKEINAINPSIRKTASEPINE